MLGVFTPWFFKFSSMTEDKGSLCEPHDTRLMRDGMTIDNIACNCSSPCIWVFSVRLKTCIRVALSVNARPTAVLSIASTFVQMRHSSAHNTTERPRTIQENKSQTLMSATVSISQLMWHIQI